MRLMQSMVPIDGDIRSFAALIARLGPATWTPRGVVSSRGSSVLPASVRSVPLIKQLSNLRTCNAASKREKARRLSRGV